MGVWVGAFIAFISPSLFLAQMGSKKRAKSAREDDASQHGSTTEELGAGPSQRGERAKFPRCLAHPHNSALVAHLLSDAQCSFT